MENQYPKITDQELVTLAEKFDLGSEIEDLMYLRQNIDGLAKEIIDSGLKLGLNDRWYRYYAVDNSLKRWRANDGSELELSLAGMIADRYEDDEFVRSLMEFDELSLPDLEYFLAKRR